MSVLKSMQRSVDQVPELRPSHTEFEHPIKYLSRPEIVKLGEKYGILKVIPPKEWKPNFSLEWDSFKFHTRIQNLHELNLRNRSRSCFLEGFNCFLQSKNLDPLPTTEDLCLGVADDCEISNKKLLQHLNGWILLKDGKRVHIHDIFISREYRKWFYRTIDADKNFLKSLTEYSKYLLKKLGLHEEFNKGTDLGTTIISPQISHTTLHRMMLSSASLLAQPDNIKQLMKMRMKSKSTTHTRKSTIMQAHRTLIKQEETNEDLKNFLSLFAIPTPPSEYAADFTKDVKLDESKSQNNNCIPLTPTILTPKSFEEKCVVCYSSESPATTLICDGCSRAFHMQCLAVPIDKIPKNDWFCDECLVGSTGVYSEYGFEEELERKFSLREFKKYCDDWEKELTIAIKSGQLGAQFKSLIDENGHLSEVSKEKIFWYLTNGKMKLPKDDGEGNSLKNIMKIRYGADINSSIPGEISGFPTLGNPRMKSEDKKYINSEWNLTKLPFAQGSLLEYICESNSVGNENQSKEQISGMSIPWLYVGGPLSTFCWHKEDHYTLSANYSHLGAPKKWYGIPARCCDTFEKVINEIAPEYEAKQRDLMHQLVSMVSPDEMIKNSDSKNVQKLEIYETIQRPGEFIVTFPKVYHSGFNYGFNVNEAVNFTLPLWIPYSVEAIREYESVRKECVFDTFSLLKKIVGDLVTEGGRKEWMDKTGISEIEVFNVMKWGYEKYREEITRFLNIFEIDINFKEEYTKLPRLNVTEYLTERKQIIETSIGLKKSGSSNVDSQKKESDLGSDDTEVDDKLCVDCKTRVHFQWVLVNLYADSIKTAESSLADEIKKLQLRKKSKSISGLGINIPDQDEKPSYVDLASELDAIIHKAKQEETHRLGDEKENLKRRQSRRISKKRSHAEVESSQGDDEERDHNTTKIEFLTNVIQSLKLLKQENGFFGISVFCVDCFRKEIGRLNEVEKKRVMNESRVIEEYGMDVLALYR